MFTSGNCLFGSVNLTKNADLDKYSNIVVMVSDSIFVENILYLTVANVKTLFFFGLGISSSVHIDNKGKNILILGKGPTKD